MNVSINRLAAAVTMALACVAGPAGAQTAMPSQNATVNLIRLLVEQGVLKPEQAEALVQQAHAEAQQAVSKAAATPGEVRVPYVPETVRDQIRDEVKAEVIAQAKSENWAQPNTFPDWVSRITVEGDVRVRNESRMFSDGNSDQIINFAKLNDSGGYDWNTNTNGKMPPMLNTRQARKNQFRIRGRLGIKAQLSENWSAGIRLATGSDDSPVSTTQTLGGGLGKKDIWLDQAYLKWRAADWVTLSAGRIENPFVSTDLLYSGDLNMDGVAAAFKHPLKSGDVTLFGTLGAFITEYANNPWDTHAGGMVGEEGKSENKWLFGGQIGAEWKINARNQLRGAVAYYRFDNIEGRRSSPCLLYDGAGNPCDTDWSRPAFMQKGNTLFLLRDVMLNPSDPNTPDPQYVGLASRFNLLDLNLRWDTRVLNGLGLRMVGNYVRNLAYDKDKMINRAGGVYNIANNFHETDNTIESGGNAWMLHVALGRSFEMKDKGDWQVFAGYKYIEPDAMPDAYNDSSFHMGGTNARGYYIGGAYAFEKNVYGQLRWMSSKEIYGHPLSIDILQLEVNARF